MIKMIGRSNVESKMKVNRSKETSYTHWNRNEMRLRLLRRRRKKKIAGEKEIDGDKDKKEIKECSANSQRNAMLALMLFHIFFSFRVRARAYLNGFLILDYIIIQFILCICV